MNLERTLTSRRDFLAAATAGAAAASSPAEAETLPRPLSVRVIASAPNVYDYATWRLWDPYFLIHGIPRISAGAAPAECDLLVIADRQGEGASRKAPPDLAAHIERARGVVAVQPAALGSPLPDALARRFGVRFVRWHHETPRYSLAAEHAAIRRIARSSGRSVLVHLPYEWHMEVDPAGAEPLTVFPGGRPDILLHGRNALIAGNVFSELLQYHRHPESGEYEADLSAIYVNLARVAAGAEPLTEPLPTRYLEHRFAFYGYAFGRKFIRDLMALQSGPSKESAHQETAARLESCDQLIARAAGRLLVNDVPAMRRLYREAAEGLVGCRKLLTTVEPYFVRGWHGGLLDDRLVNGELVGYAEWGWPTWAMRWMEDRLAASERLGYKQINQVNGQTWDVVADRNLTDVQRWKKASAAGLIESVKGMYSDAYLQILGVESNIRQFVYGLRALERMSERVRTFMVATDDFAFHPQLPQILRGFGFDHAVLRPGGPGRISGVDRETIQWQGLDGTTIPSVAHYKTVSWSRVSGPRGGVSGLPKMLADAEKAGFRTVLGGGAVDATMDMHGEREFESLNSVAPVQATSTSYPEYCRAASFDGEPRFLGADDLQGYPDFWSGYGQINQACRDDRSVERILTTAETFSSLARQAGRPYPKESLDRAWKRFLSSQDHFSYGCGGPDNPEGYHTGGLQENMMRGYNGPRIPITMEQTHQRWKRSAERAAQSALEGALSALCGVPAAAGSTSLLVFNALNWDREGLVQTWVKAPAGNSVTVSDGAREYPAEILETRGDQSLVAFRGAAPSVGFKIYTVRPGQSARPAGDVSPTVLENRFLRADLDPESGSLIRFYDKVNARELLRKGESARFLCARPEVDSARGRAEVKLDRSDALMKRVAIGGSFGSCRYRLLVTLEHETPWLEFGLEIDYGKGAIFGYKMNPDSLLRASFPLIAGTRWINLPFGVYRTTLKHATALDFCDAEDGTSGVAIVNDGMPGLHMDQGDVELLISDGFPPLRGVHRYRFCLYPHAGDWKRGRVVRRAMEFQAPLGIHHLAAAPPLPFERSYLSSTEGVILSAIHAEGDGFRARFYDATGEPRRIRTDWKFPWKNPVSVRLDGTHERDLQVRDRTIEFDLAAWRIFTIAGAFGEGEGA